MNSNATAGVHAGSASARAPASRGSADTPAASPFASLLGGAAAPAKAGPAETSASAASASDERTEEPREDKDRSDPALGVLLALGLEPLPAPPPLTASAGLLGAAAPPADAALDAIAIEAGEFALEPDADAAQGRGSRTGGALAAAVAAALAQQAAALANEDETPASSDADAALKLASALVPPTGEAPDATAQARSTANSAVAAQLVAQSARGATASAATDADSLNPASTRAADAVSADAAQAGAFDLQILQRAAAVDPAPTTPHPARAGADFSTPLPGAPTTVGTPGASAIFGALPGADGASVDALASALDARVESRSGGTAATPQAGSGLERAELTSASFASALREGASALASLHPAMPARLDPHSAGFTGVIAQQVAWQAETRIGRAEIRLEPEGLGPMDIAVELDGDEIRAEFSSRSAEVRTLLESQVPKLRELLAEQGFSLADAQVGQERAAYSDAQAQRQASAGATARNEPAESAERAAEAPVVGTRMRLGLVDDYA